jgi:PAS domain S-box-containing protein
MAHFRNCTNTNFLQDEGGLLAFAEACGNPIVIISPEGKVSYCNQAFVSQLGYTDAELPGKMMDLLFLYFDTKGCRAIGNQNSADDDGYSTITMNGLIAHKNGSSLPAELTIFPFHIGENELAVLMCRLASHPETIESLDFSANYHDNSTAPPTVSSSHKMIGTSNSINSIRDMIGLVGKTDSSVLITGESGTGKALVAEALHAASRRADLPLLKLNCAAMPETLLESELFGFMKGSFTGATKDSFGLFKAADGGTLFLDEIGEIATTSQGKLLHVLESQEFHRIGESIPIKIDVRIIAATNQDLHNRIQKGLFREDLYYRLNVIEIQVPPLRERTEDIPSLVEHFLNILNGKLGKLIHGVSDEVLNHFVAHSWPGNVRELTHALEHACIMCPKRLIHLRHLPHELQKSNGISDRLSEPHGMQSPEMIRNTLIKTGGNKALAARILGINRKTLYRKIKKYHLTSSL